MDILRNLEFMGVSVNPLTRIQLLDILLDWAGKPEKRLASHVNAHGMNLAHTDESFRDCINAADIVFCDGYGVKWGAARHGHFIPERLTVMDWIDEFAAGLAERDLSLFLLGDEEGVAEECARVLGNAHPGLLIAGTHHGFFDKDRSGNQAVLEKINASGADVLMVGLGMPLQEFWIRENFAALRPALIMPVGASYRRYAGFEQRAPGWMLNRGLEWLGRLGRHPFRMFRRYVFGVPVFVWRVFATAPGLSWIRSKKGEAQS
jgi:N-acetylglucosaminyldiphosphoundecaprenol N-acetyl-beta-D-mannosaminyltransferase